MQLDNVSLANIIAFHRACFERDKKGLYLLNLFSRKAEHTKVLDSVEIFAPEHDRIPVESQWGNKVLKTLTTYQKEKELFLGAFFLKGKTQLLGKKQSVCAPLLLYPARLIYFDKLYQIEVNPSNWSFNAAFWQVLAPQNDQIEYLERNIHRIFEKGFPSFEAVHYLQRAVDEFVKEVDVQHLSSYPDLHTGSQLRKTTDSFQLVPGLGLSVLKKGFNNRGSIFTLAALAVDALARGKSILIAAKTDQAVDVIADKVEWELGLGSIVVRAGRRDYLKRLKDRLQNILSGMGFENRSKKELEVYYRDFRKNRIRIKSLEKRIEIREVLENRFGQLSRGVFHKLPAGLSS